MLLIRSFQRGAPPADSASDGRFNDLVKCREILQSEKDPRYQNVKLYLAGTIYYLYYEDPTERPFSSILPKYGDVSVEKPSISTSTNRMDTPDRMVQPGGSNVVEKTLASKDSPLVTGTYTGSASSSHTPSPNKGDVTVSTSSLGKTRPSGSSNKSVPGSPNTKQLAKKPFKRVLMEQSDPGRFSEIILRRTVFLEHIPNAYDKAINRAFETMMMDLGLASGSAGHLE